MKTNNTEQVSTATVKPTTRRPLGRRVLRCICWVLLAVVLLIGLIICSLGAIVERYVERNDKELIGRHLELEDVDVNIFKGRATVDGCVVYEADDVTPFVRVAEASAELSLRSLFDRVIKVESASLSGLNITILQRGDTLNLDDMLTYITTRYASDRQAQQTDAAWGLTLHNLAVGDGELEYVDENVGHSWHLSDVGLTCEELYLTDEPSEIDATLVVNELGAVDGVIGFNVESFDFVFDGIVENFPLESVVSYVRSAINLSGCEGSVGAELHAEGNIRDIESMTISGSVGVEEFVAKDVRGDNLLSLSAMNVGIKELNIERQRYIFSSMTASGYSTQLLLNSDGTTNFDQLFYGEPEVSVETTAEELGNDMYDVRERVTITTDEQISPFMNVTLRIDSLSLRGGELYYADHTLHRDFEYRLSDIALSSSNFDLMGNNRITLRASLQRQSTALVQWEGSLTDFYNQSLLTVLNNVDMAELSPYVEYYTGFPVRSGNMTLRSQNVVVNGELRGVNQLGTYNFAVAKRDKSIDAEYKLPLRLGVYVLTDNGNHIDVDLPISGRIDAPEFSYRKILFKAIGNLLLKVASAPFAWMSSDKQDMFRNLNIDLLDPGLSPEHYARLDKMAEALKADNTIEVRLTPRVNYKRATQRIADLDLKIAYYNSTQTSDNKRLDMLDFTRINELRVSNSDVSKFADSMLRAKGIDPTYMLSSAKSMALYSDMVDDQLSGLLRMRGKMIADYMKFQHSDMAEDAFIVEEANIEELKSYTGRDRYVVKLVIDDEQIEIDVEDSSNELETDTVDNNMTTEALNGDAPVEMINNNNNQ